MLIINILLKLSFWNSVYVFYFEFLIFLKTCLGEGRVFPNNCVEVEETAVSTISSKVSSHRSGDFSCLMTSSVGDDDDTDDVT